MVLLKEYDLELTDKKYSGRSIQRMKEMGGVFIHYTNSSGVDYPIPLSELEQLSTNVPDKVMIRFVLKL